MSQYLIPNNQEFIELIAKAIAHDRFHREVVETLNRTHGGSSNYPEALLEKSVDQTFDRLWYGNSPQDEHSKRDYRKDAEAAIRAINLEILKMPS
jgi:hypothetical protein